MSSSATPFFAASKWSEFSTINPKTGQKWTYGDELTCSCGQVVRVGTAGFAGLKHHRSGTKHHDKLKRKIERAVAHAESHKREETAEQRAAAAVEKLKAMRKSDGDHELQKQKRKRDFDLDEEDLQTLRIRQLLKDSKKRRHSTSVLDAKIAARKENRASLGGSSSSKKHSLTKEGAVKPARVSFGDHMDFY
ncbi:hypothetical protein EXIGLDRAFT_753225 [Exidia glandulosa HHB12029]|uniref:Uncharacterized protein n=1 Tax=Exidia glandulosa HHB12029 TaxID=1314781 RepID=A0A165DX27_EXIGL|nr:hypothetical protein EXIGLDRAFT_753225 [Exidia glandulosa HHB12029]